jgi:hypothetical protein
MCCDGSAGLATVGKRKPRACEARGLWLVGSLDKPQFLKSVSLLALRRFL